MKESEVMFFPNGQEFLFIVKAAAVQFLKVSLSLPCRTIAEECRAR